MAAGEEGEATAVLLAAAADFVVVLGDSRHCLIPKQKMVK
jgi:hypothetical protein